MNPKEIALSALGCTLALSLAACTVQASPQEAENSETGADEFTIPIPGLEWGDGSKVLAEFVDLASAEEVAKNDLFDSLWTTEELNGSTDYFGSLAVTSNGELVVGKSASMDVDPQTGDLTSSSEVGILKKGEFQPFGSTQLVVRDGKHRQATGGTVDGGDSVWVETPSTDLIQSNWRIFSSKGTDEKTNLVAQAKDVWDTDELPLTSGEPVPVVANGYVYWASTSEGEGEQWGSDVVRKNLDGSGELEMVSPLAVSPAPLDDGIAVLNLTKEKFADTDSHPLLPGVPTAISLHKDGGAEEALIRTSETTNTDAAFGPLASGGGTLLTEYGSNTLIIDTKKRHVRSFSKPVNSQTSGYKICGGYATWTYDLAEGTNGEQYFFDLSSEKLRKVSNDKIFGQSECNAEYFVWDLMDPTVEGSRAYSEVMKLK